MEMFSRRKWTPKLQTYSCKHVTFGGLHPEARSCLLPSLTQLGTLALGGPRAVGSAVISGLLLLHSTHSLTVKATALLLRANSHKNEQMNTNCSQLLNIQGCAWPFL